MLTWLRKSLIALSSSASAEERLVALFERRRVSRRREVQRRVVKAGLLSSGARSERERVEKASARREKETLTSCRAREMSRAVR